MFGRRRRPAPPRPATPEVPEVRRTISMWLPDPTVRARIGALDAILGANLAGRAGPATIIGAETSRSRRWAGDLGPLQAFRGQAGGVTNYAMVRAGFNRALPGTAGPVVFDGDAGAVLQRAQLNAGMLGGTSRR